MNQELLRLHAGIRRCRACQDAGFIPEARPVATAQYQPDALLSREACRGLLGSGRVMLVGQAPGVLEAAEGEHFVGRAGRVLFGWLRRIGVDEAAFRRHVYVTAVTKCYPGKAVAPGGGDRAPSREEVALCRPFLERQVALIDPKLLVLTGRMAIDLYLPRRSLDEAVGQVFAVDGRELLPLPHPSGMSRWLNSAANRARLDQALSLLRQRLAPDLAAGGGKP